MPRRVNRLHLDARKSGVFALLHPVIDRRRPRPRESHVLRLARPQLVELAIAFVQPDGSAGRVVERLHHEDVVDVRVREENAPYGEPARLQQRKDVCAVERGIDHDGVRSLVRGEDVEIVVERSDGEALDAHGQPRVALIAVIPNIGSPTMSTSVKPASRRSP